MAASRPDPCPLTITLTFFKPTTKALVDAFWAAFWAAKGVPFRVPLNPILPAEAQEIVSPLKFVIVTIVLLNVD